MLFPDPDVTWVKPPSLVFLDHIGEADRDVSVVASLSVGNGIAYIKAHYENLRMFHGVILKQKEYLVVDIVDITIWICSLHVIHDAY